MIKNHKSAIILVVLFISIPLIVRTLHIDKVGDSINSVAANIIGMNLQIIPKKRYLFHSGTCKPELDPRWYAKKIFSKCTFIGTVGGFDNWRCSTINLGITCFTISIPNDLYKNKFFMKDFLVALSNPCRVFQDGNLAKERATWVYNRFKCGNSIHAKYNFYVFVKRETQAAFYMKFIEKINISYKYGYKSLFKYDYNSHKLVQLY